MKTKHTPEPWTLSNRGDFADFDGHSRVILADNPPIRIAVIHDHGSDEDQANARLIVKTPEMLSALKAIQHFLHFGEPSKAAKVAEEVLGEIEQS